ncbi:unnamed protein product [Microthlaspi erraticum]|uniref:Histone deacetylase interacting domain-containing protein n=1 Tax=Microthlaspi erraticum TaxID=1685480 RepID=A0A6D2HHM4_9BRAS|nr:unnamed protein product [Microthlaspi erraticum]
MKNCKRPRTIQTPSTDDYSEEEIQRGCKFLRNLYQTVDKKLFRLFAYATESYQSGSLDNTAFKNRVAFLLRDHDVLLEEFRRLYSDSTREKKKKKSDVERTVEFINKLEALGENVYKAFVDALWYDGDFEVLIEQLQEPLREEFKTFLIESGFLKRKRGLETAAPPNTPEDNVTPSYWIRPEAKAGEGSCSHEVLNGKYYSKGRYDDPETVGEKRSKPYRDVRMNNREDRLMEEDMFLRALTLVVEFGENVMNKEELGQKLPLRFNDVVEWFYQGKKVPQIFKTDPKRGLKVILPRLQSLEEVMRKEKEARVLRRYERVMNRKK